MLSAYYVSHNQLGISVFSLLSHLFSFFFLKKENQFNFHILTEVSFLPNNGE
jgi:hypothetical protein